MVVVVDIVVEFHDGREREKKKIVWLALSSIESSSSLCGVKVKVVFFLFLSLFWMVWFLPPRPFLAFGITLSSLSRKKTREREPPRRRWYKSFRFAFYFCETPDYMFVLAMDMQLLGPAHLR